VSGELENGTLTIWTSGDGANISWVVDSNNDTCGEDNLLPGLSNVENGDTIGTSLPDLYMLLVLIGVGLL
jgi:hypothetical protein